MVNCHPWRRVSRGAGRLGRRE